MPVFRWGHTLTTLRDLEQEVDRLFESMSFHLPGFRIGRLFPAVNVYDAGHELLITAEIPGCSVNDIELSVTNGVLTLKGESSETNKVSEDKYRRRERRLGSWERSITLPERIEEEGLTAELNHGILMIHLPKLVPPPARSIPISGGK
jgi:HSP20 family protein